MKKAFLCLALILTLGRIYAQAQSQANPPTVTQHQTTPAPKPPAWLDRRVRDEAAKFEGTVDLYAKNLATGAEYSFGGDERVRTASTIKIAIMIEAFARVAEGKAKWTDDLVLTKAARYGGSGILPELSDGLRLTLKDSLRLMMLLSDNTATNMVLDYLTA